MLEEKKKKQNSLPFLLAGLGIVLLIAGYYVYTVYFQSAPQEAFTEGEASKQFPLKKVDWEKELFGSPVFQSLTTAIPSEVTVSQGETGNSLPFIITK